MSLMRAWEGRIRLDQRAVDKGQLYKVSKSKDGIVEKCRLTKQWTDWVDYWAVDFDYLQRREIIA